VIWNQNNLETLAFPNSDILTTKSWAFSLLKDSASNVWISALDQGLLQIRNGSLLNVFSDQLPSPSVPTLFEDNQHRLWIGTEAGLACHKNGKIINFAGNNALPKGSVTSIAEDSTSNIWVNIANYGLYRSTSEMRFQLHQKFSQKQSVRPLCMLTDSSKCLWIGYSGGKIGRWENGVDFSYTIQNGLPDTPITTIIDDNHGNLWSGTGIGIVRISRDSLNTVQKQQFGQLDCTLFDKADGMRTATCRTGYQPNSIRSFDGRLWFSTLQGLAVVNPDNSRPHLIPTTLIQKVTINEQVFEFNFLRTNKMILPPGRKRIAFSFIGISMETPERVKYQYKLEPLDNEWISIGKDRSVQFSDLSPKTYRFRVRSSVDINEWSSPDEIQIIIPPFFWQTNVFKFIAGICAILLSIVITNILLRHRFHQRLQYTQRQFAEEKALQLQQSNLILQERQRELEEALTNIKTLSGMIPICASCHKVRDDKGFWERVETYIQQHSTATFSHGICPDCAKKLYPDFYKAKISQSPPKIESSNNPDS
jgi:hypothetical protein